MPGKNSHNRRKQIACDRAAQQAHDNAAQPGFNLLLNGDPLTSGFSRSHTVDQLKADFAARQIEHTLEAWHYLSQAAIALLNSQENIAIHLAYYAEVRAANSLLAASGVSNKEQISHYVDSNYILHELKVPTHELIRRIWAKWCNRADAKQAFTSLPIAPSVTLQDIGNAIGIQNIQTNLLQKWSFDLVNLTNDHHARNNASYNVTKAFNGIPQVDFEKNSRLLKLIWEHIQPAARPGECQFEISYAQYLLSEQCRTHAERPDKSIDEARYYQRLDTYIEVICRSTGAPIGILNNLLRIPPARPSRFELFDLASEQRTNPENIIARAAILCRLASNKLNGNIQLASCNQAIDWISTWLRNAFIIQSGDNPYDIASFIDDYFTAVDEICTLDGYSIWQRAATSAHKSSRLDHALCWVLDYDLA